MRAVRQFKECACFNDKTTQMKLQLKSGRAVEYPRTPHDVTLAQFIRYNNDVRSTLPAEVIQFDELAKELKETESELQAYMEKTGTETVYDLQTKINSGNVKDNVRRFAPALISRWTEIASKMEQLSMQMNNLWLSQYWHPYQLRTVQAVTGIQDELTVDELGYLYGKCMEALQQPKEVQYKQLYLHDGITYTLPDNLMKKSTLIEFAEAAQYETALKQAQGGDANGLLKMCAVLLRPVGIDQYSEEVFERNVSAFQTLPLQVAYEVSFFLTWLSSKYALDLMRSTLATAAAELD